MMYATKTSKRRTFGRVRKGSVAVEFAVTASILFLIVFALFELSRVHMIRNTAENAAYEGCRVAVLPGSTNTKVQAASSSILSALGIQPSDIDVDDSTSGEVTVSVTVPLDSTNAFFITKYTIGNEVVGTCTFHVTNDI